MLRRHNKNMDRNDIYTKKNFSAILWNCHNIIRGNDKLSPEAAFDEISKVLFIKICKERYTLSSEGVYGSDAYKRDKSAENKSSADTPYFQLLFQQTKDEFASDEIFEKSEKMRIKESSFESILKELEAYNLATIDDDVKGVAFESFLSKTFRGELGQFFTPRTVVDFMVGILDPKEGERICDPCCGSGGFLIKAFEYVKAKIKEEHPSDVDWRISELANKHINGTDANPRMARIAKMNMIMHGDGHSGVYHHDGLLNIGGIEDGAFDVIITNPPFGARVDKNSKITEEDGLPKNYLGKKIVSLYKISKYSKATEVLFIERCLNLLKPGKRMGIVLPEGVLGNGNMKRIREFVEARAKILLIVSLPVDVFVSAGASVKSSIVFLQKFTEAERAEREKAAKEMTAALKKEHQFTDSEIADRVAVWLRENYCYEVPMSDIQFAGIDAMGDDAKNQLPELLDEYRNYLSNQSKDHEAAEDKTV